MFGEKDTGYYLPLERVQPESVLVNVHPQKNAGPLSGVLFGGWKDGGLDMLRMPGGSPAFFLLEAAKGSFSYINLWSRHPATVYDLLAGILIVRGAGGDVVDPAGVPVDGMGHSGPFIAGVDADIREKIIHLVKQEGNP